jgi:hypothetical protein
MLMLRDFAGTYAALVAHCEPGDEVILFEPFFDQYFASIHFQHAKPVYVPLHPPTGDGVKSGADWKIDFDELRKAFSPKTKAIIVNTPHNPVGKVFSRDELEKIAQLCIEFNVLCLADEVYDCMVYDGLEHVRIASLPGMWERTLTIGSGGSECGAERLIRHLCICLLWLVTDHEQSLSLALVGVSVSGHGSSVTPLWSAPRSPPTLVSCSAPTRLFKKPLRSVWRAPRSTTSSPTS